MTATQNRIIRAKELRKITGLSHSTLWRIQQRDPSFPSKVRLSTGCVGWKLSEVYAWIESR